MTAPRAGLMDALASGLAARRSAGLLRSRRVLEGPQGPQVTIDGSEYLSFSSNDYLGLAADPRLTAAAHAAADRFGNGAGAAHLLHGHCHLHQMLEEALAEHTGRERALLFSTGYMANLGAVQALAGAGDTVLQDRLDHASLLDAARLSGARHGRYPHARVEALEPRLARGRGRKLVLTDAVFSMDGDRAPLAELAACCQRQDAILMVDDAHGYGVLGSDGAGSVAAAGLGDDEVPVLMATLGKALGCFGAFVAGDATLIDHLINHARSYIYTTALPPAVAGAALCALGIVREEPERRQRVLALATRFQTAAAQIGLRTVASTTPIQAVILGDAETALAAAEALAERGLLVPAVRPPTVPEGAARLRVSLSAAHTESDVDRLVDALDQIVVRVRE
jgi:8-amino-7-oxononanoate synthase